MRMQMQRGFSLVELMIALVLGLMVSGGVLQAFIYNNRGVELQREAVSLQEQARAALEFVTRYTRMAGFREDDLTAPSLGTGVNGTNNSLTIEYQAGASNASVSLYDCLGRPTSAGWVSANTFRINGNDSFVCNTGFRTTATGDPATPSDTDFETGILIERIKDFQMLYGIDSDDDSAANQYVKFGGVGNWNDVVALKVCLSLESENEVLPSAQVYQDCEGQDYADTRRMVRQVKATIALRNRIGGG